MFDAEQDWDALARTFEKLQIWSHTAPLPFYCDVCDIRFTTRQQLDKAAPNSKPAMSTWVRNHYGIEYQHPVVFVPTRILSKQVEDHYVSCCLHWLLRQVDAGFMHTVHAHADTDEKAQALTAQLKAHGTSLSKAIKKWQAYKAAKDRAGSATFIGDHAVVVLAEYDSYLDLHTPMDREDIYEALWLAMVHTYECIHEVMEDTPDNREKKAKAIAEAAQALAWAWEDAAPSSRPPYIHIAMVHIPRAVLKHGTNVDQYSGQGIEHLGKLRQIWQQCAANRKARQMRNKKPEAPRRRNMVTRHKFYFTKTSTTCA
ncbi:hypothetical protein CYMTET_54610 [Cymbomonas tetramitiformis]|uniref:Uncharacterized protein n=1 Tax=Cymbomonas tetramitiformis TaxID=36881 RepID=A0AAE0BGD0_9CHLO|nr:hypothetical protein CYMTET_54610 [Cymbomonas tetramitiformis]